MLAVTDRFLRALRHSHTLSVTARVYPPSAPTTPVEVPVLGGSLTIDRDARVRRQGTLEVAFSLGEDLTREIVRELPFGGYAAIERGILYPDGESERVQLGMLRVDAIAWSELEGHATLTLADRMAQVQDEPFVTPYTPNGLHPSDAAVAIVQAVFGSSIAYHVLTNPAAETTLLDTVYAEDRAQALADLASSVGAEALFDHLGDFVIRPRGTVGPVAWTVDSGDEGTLVGATETLDRSTVRNGVSVAGLPAADAAPVYALATYDDPTAPTRWGGPFGKVALISSSSAVSSQAQADATAASLLNLRLGMARTVTLDAVPNPAIEPGDLIEIVYADGRSEQQLVNAVHLDLSPEGALQIVTTGQYLGETRLGRPTIRLFSGHDLWRELADARLVPA